MNAIKMAYDSETHQISQKLAERLEEIRAEHYGKTDSAVVA